MKRKNYRLLSAIVLSGVILASFGGCGDKDSSSNEAVPATTLNSEQLAAVQKPGLKFTYGEPATSGNQLDSPDPTAPAATSSSAAASTEAPAGSVVVVTDSQGSAVTEIAAVTDSAGAVVTTQAVVTDSAGVPVTEAGGQTVTTVVNVTEVVTKTELVTVSQEAANSGADNTDTSSSSSETETTTSSGSNYQSNMKSFNAIWFDVSDPEGKNYTFNDTFIEVRVKINEDIPDGKYPINITWPDFAARDPEVVGKSVDVDHTINGYLYVNTPVENQDIPSDGFTVIAQNVEGKQGEEAVLKFDIKNNPGLAGINFNFEYDENAITIEEAYAVGEFEKISNGSLS